MSTSFLPPPISWDTVRTAFRARLHIKSDHLATNFVPIEEEIRLYMALSSLISTGNEISSMMLRASARARLKAAMIWTGWILRSSCGRACARISPAGCCQSMSSTPHRSCHT